MAAMTASLDELFRQKTLQEIHAILKKTRQDVDAKKQELRELVGDHYRSILESSDHIRAMSERAAEVSAGADRLAGLIASMQSLAGELPSGTSIAPVQNRSAPKEPEVDLEYRLGKQVMAVLEVPDTVRARLSDLRFVQAARATLVDLVESQKDVQSLLAEQKLAGGGLKTSFDYMKLMQQQTALVRSLPQQIAASCVDAFSVPSLQPVNAIEAFAMRLLLDGASQPGPLLRLFLERRRDLLIQLLDGTFAGLCRNGEEEASRSGARLASAAIAFEGTIVLGARLIGGCGGDDAPLVSALSAALEGTKERTYSEELAAIEGRRADVSTSGLSALQKRAETLNSTLRPGGSAAVGLAQELAVTGSGLARDWVAESEQADVLNPAGKGLQARFARLAASLASIPCGTEQQKARANSAGSTPSCALLGQVLQSCTEQIHAHRRSLASDRLDKWPSTWSEACSRFCPGRSPMRDALAILGSTAEVVCAEVVRERVAALKLELLPHGDDIEAETGTPALPESGAVRPGAASGQRAAEATEAQRFEEIAEMRRQSQSRIQAFNEQLGEVLNDLSASTNGQDLPVTVVRALVRALRARLTAVSESVRLPEPIVASTEGDQVEVPWRAQRSAARAAIALDVLFSAASDSSGDSSSSSSSSAHVREALKMAASYGNPEAEAEAQSLLASLHQRSDAAFLVWASFTAVPTKGSVPMEAFWQLADDEVALNCGWGSAKFTKNVDQIGGQARSVPVPVQASPFVFERLAMASRRALEVSGGAAILPTALVAALKAALSESFLKTFMVWKSEDVEKRKRSGMSHLLQWLFDLRFLRIVLSSGDSIAGATSTSRPAGQGKGGAAYESLCKMLEELEASSLSDPVDRLLYQEVLKESVKLHIDGVKILLSPLFMHNPLYAFLFPGRAVDGAETQSAGQAPPAADDGFEIHPTFAPPLRPLLPRFPLLPVATASSHSIASSSLDPRLGLGTDSERARAAAASGVASGSAAAVSSLMQQFGSGLESLGFSKAFAPLGGTSFWSTSGIAGGGGGAPAPAAPSAAPGAPRAPLVPQPV